MNIYFSGIGGVGLGPLAEIAIDAGYDVVGSDPNDSLITQELYKRGVLISASQDGTFLQSRHSDRPIDWFVYTSALPIDHPELALAQNLGIKTAKRDELLAYIIKDKELKLIAIAGTHGKTTTTGMIVWVLQQLNVPISYSVGTTITFGPSGKYSPTSEYFVYECDEFDRNFLNFTPYLSIITSIDYDHPDTYPTEQNYLDAFRQYASNSKKIIAWSDQHSEIYNQLSQAVILDSTQINPEIKLAGIHNRRNGTLAQKALNELGFDQDIEKILNNFPGTDRRFEKIADNLYSDYAHHPVEIAATLQMARELSDHVVAVYQPHQNLRQHNIRDQYTDQFKLADDIYWLPTYLSREDKNLPILTVNELSQNIVNKDSVHAAEFNDELWDNIKKARSDGKLVVLMGAGETDKWVRDQIFAII